MVLQNTTLTSSEDERKAISTFEESIQFEINENRIDCEETILNKPYPYDGKFMNLQCVYLT